MIYEIGLTGGIGSGKSTVARIFQTLGFEVYISDDRAKELMQQDPEVISALQAEFGKDIYTPEGKLDRKQLAGIVFTNPAKLKSLNGIVHPAVFKDGARWKKELEAADYPHPFCLKEAAILFESGSYRFTDKIISIYAPKSVRLNRVTARDQTQRQQVLDRMNNQFTDDFKVRNADFVIYNDGQHLLIPQVQQAISYFSHAFKQ